MMAQRKTVEEALQAAMRLKCPEKGGDAWMGHQLKVITKLRAILEGMK
ncbi:MAG: hypothetical protein M0Q95_18090 [Porticoccaceae bacterium]|nr:hypothetical protein [Porticoccaceae bacterium]